MKTDDVRVRLERSDKALFRRAAEFAGISLSSWMRERLRKIARQETRGAAAFETAARRQDPAA